MWGGRKETGEAIAIWIYKRWGRRRTVRTEKEAQNNERKHLHNKPLCWCWLICENQQNRGLALVRMSRQTRGHWPGSPPYRQDIAFPSRQYSATRDNLLQGANQWISEFYTIPLWPNELFEAWKADGGAHKGIRGPHSLNRHKAPRNQGLVGCERCAGSQPGDYERACSNKSINGGGRTWFPWRFLGQPKYDETADRI